MLDLVKDVPGHDGEHAVSPPAALKLRQQHANLDCLAEPDRVGDELADEPVRV